MHAIGWDKVIASNVYKLAVAILLQCSIASTAYQSSNNAISNLPAVLVFMLKPEVQKLWKCPFNISKLNLLFLTVPHQHSQTQQGPDLNISAAGLEHLRQGCEDPLQLCHKASMHPVDMNRYKYHCASQNLNVYTIALLWPPNIKQERIDQSILVL